MHESESEVTQLCPTPSNPMDCSLPGSSIHGILQARVLEWGAIAFSVNFTLGFTIYLAFLVVCEVEDRLLLFPYRWTVIQM